MAGEDDMTGRAEDFDRDDERDQYGAKTNDNQGNDNHGSSAEQAEENEREMEESGEENAA
jgi:hypothetical protein